MSCGIYKITNKVNQKIYIGQSINIEERFYRHKLHSQQEKGREKNKPLYLSMRKYGIDNFLFEILEECLSSELNDKEVYWISYYQSADKEKGYNLSLGPQYGTFQEINEEILTNIIYDLEFTSLTNEDIGKKYNLSKFYISKINNGHHLRRDREYPIRKKENTINYCNVCGVKIVKQAEVCLPCYRVKSRVVERPDKFTLAKEIIDTSFAAVGRKYGVSDNAIRKWCVTYGIPKNKKELIEWVGKYG